MNPFESVIPVIKDMDGNFPRLHFDIRTQQTTCTLESMLRWVLAQRSTSQVSAYLDPIPMLCMTGMLNGKLTVDQSRNAMNDAITALEESANELYEIAVEFSYNPVYDENAAKACRIIISNRVREVAERYGLDVPKNNDESVVSMNDMLRGVLTSAALMKSIIDMMTGVVPYDASRIAAMTEVSLDDFPPAEREKIKTAIGILKRNLGSAQ